MLAKIDARMFKTVTDTSTIVRMAARISKKS